MTFPIFIGFTATNCCNAQAPNKVTAAKNGLKLVQKEMEKGKWNEGNGIEKQQGVFMTEIELEDRSLQMNEKLFKH